MGQDVNLTRKIAAENVGCVFAYFCDGHRNNFSIWFRNAVPRSVIKRPTDNRNTSTTSGQING